MVLVLSLASRRRRSPRRCSPILGVATENTAKWWQNRLLQGTTFRGRSAIIDEASLAGTLSLDRITHLAQDAGAKVLLVGDYAQLQSVDAGGAFAVIANDRDDLPSWSTFRTSPMPGRRPPPLELRHGRARPSTPTSPISASAAVTLRP